jgi:flagellar biosynthesis protein FliQ
MIYQALAISAPILAAAMIIGLAVSLFQAVTTISEQTLTFVPKALAVIGVLLLLLPWIMSVAHRIHHRRHPENAADGAMILGRIPADRRCAGCSNFGWDAFKKGGRRKSDGRAGEVAMILHSGVLIFADMELIFTTGCWSFCASARFCSCCRSSRLRIFPSRCGWRWRP